MIYLNEADNIFV